MNVHEIIILLIYTVLFILVLSICEFLYRKYHPPVETTRKIAHVMASTASIGFVYTLESHWCVLLLAVVFSGILYWGKKSGKLKAIDHVERETYGSILIPLGIYCSFLIGEKTHSQEAFILSMLILGFADPVAAVSGMYAQKRGINKKLIFEKTFVGSLFFFITSLGLSWLALHYLHVNNAFNLALKMAVLLTGVELLSPNGSDNLTVPVATSFAYILL
ncbi:MAG: phosphatidate cytidylyltransferase [Crocinitomicaceae bacterium]|nr:phosphatidate cytidylyltransferase [Crocinitomicaceae bacterium]|tara:strand:+ start:4381 stop:5037 length:657 start_codon:yes stop_codon:yes gene_type:complete